MKTQAEQVAERFTDGQTYTTAAGESLDTVARAAGAAVEVREAGLAGTLTRYEFPDGSVIIDSGEGWDLGFPGCWCWQTNGHDDDCRAVADTLEVPHRLAALPPDQLAAILDAVDDVIACILNPDEGPYEDATDRFFKACRAAAEGEGRPT